MSTRTERVQEFLRQEISDILMRDIKDPRLGFVTVTGVEVTKDLRHAKVFVSIMGDEAAKEQSLMILQRASGHIRSEVAHRSTMKTTPQLSFRTDTAVEQGSRIFEILQQVKRKDEE